MTGAEQCETCAELAAVTLRFDGEDEPHHYCVACAERVRNQRTGPQFVIRRGGELHSAIAGWRCACGKMVVATGTTVAARAWLDHLLECPVAFDDD